MAPSRPQIRAFLSSTFSDFLEERSLLVKKVFPELRRKAKERGVEVVEVDLRWGITEEQSKQGKTIGICLDEIERCRPYFIGLVGDRYGWVPQLGDYNPELLARENWIAQHQGGASVTELEILHGVLNNPEMAGRAFFYFRDPAYSDAKASAGEGGWRSDDTQEREKLEQLKQKIRNSGFPVVEKGLATPQAIADRIEADLWSLIEEQYPDEPKTDVRELEVSRHASYRADRTGLYLGGESYIQQLQDWISAGEQRILITGESGSGKSALIANWVAAHGNSHPDDVIFCHHLGCSNDANAMRPLLARMIDSASRLLVEAEELSEPLKVPQDWWELVSQLTNTLSRLSVWAIRQQRRWIWVLDGLDKLDLEDQQALPWLPLVLPEGVHLVASALDCQVRTLLQERQFTELTIGPLGGREQEQLIQKYLKLYTKELVPALRQKITSHRQGSSPLFLRVLLEELRLCGRFETLAEQLQGYLTAESVADLYELVLQRLEDDGHGDAVRKVMTALWASRAGLSENELLAITGLVHAQWAPIGIGLQEALCEANGRLVFGHDFLRQAVRDRYLPLEEQRLLAHSELVDWFGALTIWDERKAEELPWQLVQSDNFSCLRELLSGIETLEKLAAYLKPRDIIAYWRICMVSPRDAIDAAIAKGIEVEIKKRTWNAQALCQFATLISELLEEDQLYNGLLLRLRVISLDATRENQNMMPVDLGNSIMGTDSDLPRLLNFNKDRYSLDSPAIYTRHELKMLDCLANAYFQAGRYSVAQNIYVDSVHGWQNLCGWESIDTHSALCGLAKSCSKNGMTDWAEVMHGKSLKLIRNLKGKDNPATIKVMLGMAINYTRMGKHRTSEQLNRRCYQVLCRICGSMHQDALTALNNLGASLAKQGKYDDAIKSYQICADSHLQAFGADSPRYLSALAKLNKTKELNSKARNNSA